jgi:hypothetical protein
MQGWLLPLSAALDAAALPKRLGSTGQTVAGTIKVAPASAPAGGPAGGQAQPHDAKAAEEARIAALIAAWQASAGAERLQRAFMSGELLATGIAKEAETAHAPFPMQLLLLVRGWLWWRCERKQASEGEEG